MTSLNKMVTILRSFLINFKKDTGKKFIDKDPKIESCIKLLFKTKKESKLKFPSYNMTALLIIYTTQELSNNHCRKN